MQLIETKQKRVTKSVKFIGGSTFTGWHVRPGDICRYGKRGAKEVIVIQMGIKRALVKNKDGSEQYVAYDLLSPINSDGSIRNKWGEITDYFAQVKSEYEGITQLNTSSGLIDIRDISKVSLAFHFGRSSLGLHYLGMVTLAVEGVQVLSESQLRKTVLHEIAHAMAPTKQHHGPKWRAVDKYLGGSGNTYAEESIEQYVLPAIREGFNKWSDHTPVDRMAALKDRINKDKSVYSLIANLNIIKDVMPWVIENYPNMNQYKVRGDVGYANVVHSVLWILERNPMLMKAKHRVKWWRDLSDQLLSIILFIKSDDTLQGKSNTLTESELRKLIDEIEKDVRRFRRLK